MTQKEFEEIKQNLDNYSYSSMNYCDYEDVKHYDILCNTENLILLRGYNTEAQVDEYHWASNRAEEIIREIGTDSGLVTFIPHDWIKVFEDAGYRVRNAWQDYFLESLEKVGTEAEAAETLKPGEYKEASEVTLTCRNQSRGFTGQSPQWVQSWLEEEDGFTQNNAIFVWRCAAGELTGIVCTATYGQESEKGPVCWIREVAVKPSFQNQGIAGTLIRQALSYGKQHGAVRAFLAADECNESAIHLYTSIGFRPSKDKSQIDMMK